jgi:hypothetical protein
MGTASSFQVLNGDDRQLLAKPKRRGVVFQCYHAISSDQMHWITADSAINAIRNERIRRQHIVTTPN